MAAGSSLSAPLANSGYTLPHPTCEKLFRPVKRRKAEGEGAKKQAKVDGRGEEVQGEIWPTPKNFCVALPVV